MEKVTSRQLNNSNYFASMGYGLLGGGGGLGHFHGKVTGMLVISLGYKIPILVFFGVFRKILCRNEILVFFRVCSFSISSENEKFPKRFQ